MCGDGDGHNHASSSRTPATGTSAPPRGTVRSRDTSTSGDDRPAAKAKRPKPSGTPTVRGLSADEVEFVWSFRTGLRHRVINIIRAMKDKGRDHFVAPSPAACSNCKALNWPCVSRISAINKWGCIGCTGMECSHSSLSNFKHMAVGKSLAEVRVAAYRSIDPAFVPVETPPRNGNSVLTFWSEKAKGKIGDDTTPEQAAATTRPLEGVARLSPVPESTADSPVPDVPANSPVPDVPANSPVDEETPAGGEAEAVDGEVGQPANTQVAPRQSLSPEAQPVNNHAAPRHSPAPQITGDDPDAGHEQNANWEALLEAVDTVSAPSPAPSPAPSSSGDTSSDESVALADQRVVDTRRVIDTKLWATSSKRTVPSTIRPSRPKRAGNRPTDRGEQPPPPPPDVTAQLALLSSRGEFANINLRARALGTRTSDDPAASWYHLSPCAVDCATCYAIKLRPAPKYTLTPRSVCIFLTRVQSLDHTVIKTLSNVARKGRTEVRQTPVPAYLYEAAIPCAGCDFDGGRCLHAEVKLERDEEGVLTAPLCCVGCEVKGIKCGWPVGGGRNSRIRVAVGEEQHFPTSPTGVLETLGAMGCP